MTPLSTRGHADRGGAQVCRESGRGRGIARWQTIPGDVREDEVVGDHDGAGGGEGWKSWMAVRGGKIAGVCLRGDCSEWR